jgi:hypothetical protein
LLAAAYPDLIDSKPGRWVGSNVVLFGSPTGTQGFSGRYKHVEIHKFLIAGQIDWYDLESEDLTARIGVTREA